MKFKSLNPHDKINLLIKRRFPKKNIHLQCKVHTIIYDYKTGKLLGIHVSREK